MAIDVFEVFDRRSGGNEPDQPSGPRFQGVKTAFAVTVAVAVLIGLAWGVLSAFRGITTSDPAKETCAPKQLEAQESLASWLGERASQATGATDAKVTRTGCDKATALQPVGAVTYLVDEEQLSGAVATLDEHNCSMELTAAKSGSCTVDIEGATATVTIAETPDTDTTANGDYVWSVTLPKDAS